MTARIIDGKVIAADLRGRVADEVARIKRDHRLTPGLAVVLVGNDPASEVYVRSKHKQTQAAGMASFEHVLPADVAQDEIAGTDRANSIAIPPCTASWCNCRCRNRCDTETVINAIDPAKDVDGLHPNNAGRLAGGSAGAVAVHAARLHHPDQERACLARRHERHRDRPLQPGRPSAGAVAAERKRHGDDRAFALARPAGSCAPAPISSMPRSAGRKWCAATGSSPAPP